LWCKNPDLEKLRTLGSNLCVPLIGRSPRKSDFHYIIEQVSAKLAQWKANQLSFAGRVTLAKSVIEAIPIYPMMSMLLPKSCLDEIQKLQRGFIWGDNENGRIMLLGGIMLVNQRKMEVLVSGD
jgi:hypothetical protein